MTSWRVVRQDDNGNIYLVADALDEAGARELADRLEARAHKQMYSVERVTCPSGDEEAPASGGHLPHS
jgi:hypothetical protein